MSKANQIPENLPYLQNLIKRDFDAYHAEFLQQYRRYESNLQVFLLQPSENSKILAELIMFVAQVSHCYPGDVKNFPQQLREILQAHGTVLNPDIRLTICRALMLLKKKSLVAPTLLYELFFDMFRCQDKRLRELLSTFITKDVRSLNKKNKNNALNKSMQNNMYTLLSGNNPTVVKMSLKVMVELYQRKVWNDSKTVNVISTACFSKFPKVLAIALKFFLGNDRAVVDDSDSEDDIPTARDLMVRYQTSKKNTRRKIRQKKTLRKIRKRERKSAKKKENKINIDFSAIHQLNDPDGFADKLYKKLQKSNNSFEVRLMMIMVLGRVIGIHNLFMFNFYPFLQRFLQPHQKEVTKILLALAQASHELIPPEILKDSIRTIANNFVTDRNSSEVMAVGINSIREICSRCPLAMSEDLLQDLTSYQHKHGKSVLAAARSLVALYRTINPKMLRKRDRGKFTQATKELALPAYGEVMARDFVPGSEILPDLSSTAGDMNNDGWEVCSESSDSDDGSWINVSSDEELEAMIAKNREPGEELEKIEEMTEEDKLAKSKELSQTRIFTPADFNLISAHQERKQVMPASVKTAKKRKRVTFADECTEGGDVVALTNIEDIVSKKKRDKETRLAEAMASKADRTKKSGHQKLDPYASTTNRIKLKRKPFMMVRPKMMKKKTNRSFQEKQIALRNSLLKKAKKYKIR